MPDLSDIHVSRALDSLAIAIINAPGAYIHRRLCHVRKVTSQSGTYKRYGIDFGLRRSTPGSDARVTATLRAGNARAIELDYDLESGTYKTSEYSASDFVSDREVLESDSPLRAITDAAEALSATLLNDLEHILARLVLDASLYPVGGKAQLTTGGSGTSWKSYTSSASSPLTNIRNGRTYIRESIGHEANVLALNAQGADVLGDHPELAGILKYTDGNFLIRQTGTPEELRALRIIVSTAVSNQEDLGATATKKPIFVDSSGAAAAVLAYVPPGEAGARSQASFLGFDGVDPTTGRHGLSLRSYRDDDRKGWVINASVQWDLRWPNADGTGDNTGAYFIQDLCV